MILKKLAAEVQSEGMRETPAGTAQGLVEMAKASRIDTAALTKAFQAECRQAVCHDRLSLQGTRQAGISEHGLLPTIKSITICRTELLVRFRQR